MRQTGHDKREFEKDREDEYQEDPLDPLLREIARDSHAYSDSSEALSLLPAKGDIIDGRFEIDRRLGTGGMGTVFSATHRVTKKRVAIKWMLPAQSIKREAVHRFIREAQLAGRIDHPNVVDVYDFGKHERGYYLVMELLRGEPLSARLEGNCVYSYKEAIEFLMPVMRGVAAAHAAGVIHRDLKPANIFLCQGADGASREPKVLDFGISKLLVQPGQPEQFETSDNTFLGTPAYTAPERLRANKTIDCRADVYSLGVILYELIAGRLPFSVRGFSELLIEITAGVAVPLIKHRPELPAELNDVVMKSMAREPDERYSSVRSLALALEPFVEGVRFETAGRSGPLPRGLFAALRYKRSRTLWAVGVLIAALGAVIFFSMERNRPAIKARATNSYVSPQTLRVADKPDRRQIEHEAISVSNPSTTRIQEAITVSAPAPAESQLPTSSIVKKPTSKTTERATRKTAIATREVSLVNSRRAVVEVTVQCRQGPFQIVLPAKSKATVSIPKQNCGITCRGAGEPVCPITLRSTAESLIIY